MFSKFTAGITSKRGKFRLRQGKRGNKQMGNATELSEREEQATFLSFPFLIFLPPVDDARSMTPFNCLGDVSFEKDIRESGS